MPLPTINQEDFKGDINISQAGTINTDFDAYIETYIQKGIRDTLGDAAFVQIRDNTRQKWQDLFNGVDYTDKNGDVVYQHGMTNALRYFIYFFWCRDSFMNSPNGNVSATFESNKFPRPVLRTL